ncbi:MAG: GatB/YqeY domain-containing protein [Gammaproteobacteria bacterium]|nr:MAG: GatB/YqeY domain-containing protein [Gammaproteobacteria bacterium]
MLTERIRDDMKQAMRDRAKDRLSTIRLILAAVKQQEVDRRVILEDAEVLAILDKMVKQRRDSIEQFDKAGRDDLSSKEKFEIEVIQNYLPKPLSDQEISDLIAEAISTSGAESMRDMGKVMGILKPKMQGRADMGKVSGLIKSQLG